jgi:two-component system CheB/CheR fusion protein
LLDLSKIESGKLELDKTAFDLGTLVEETVQDMRQTASKHAIILHNDFEGKVFADKDRIAQVLLNLLTNAIKYSPDADNIEVFTASAKDRAIIRVKDFGIGIDNKSHIRIFERFYRVEGKSEQTFPGFGIGLFIASEIVHRHNGSISVQSEKGKGSVFTVSIPVNAEMSQE